MGNSETVERFRSTFMAQAEFICTGDLCLYRSWERNDILSYKAERL